MTVEELIEALSLMPKKDPVFMWDGVSQAANFSQEVDSVVMMDDLSGILIVAGEQ